MPNFFAATDTTSSNGHSHRGPGVLVGSFNISEQDGAFPDLSRVCTISLLKAFSCLKIAFMSMLKTFNTDKNIAFSVPSFFEHYLPCSRLSQLFWVLLG